MYPLIAFAICFWRLVNATFMCLCLRTCVGAVNPWPRAKKEWMHHRYKQPIQSEPAHRVYGCRSEDKKRKLLAPLFRSLQTCRLERSPFSLRRSYLCKWTSLCADCAVVQSLKSAAPNTNAIFPHKFSFSRSRTACDTAFPTYISLAACGYPTRNTTPLRSGDTRLSHLLRFSCCSRAPRLALCLLRTVPHSPPHATSLLRPRPT